MVLVSLQALGIRVLVLLIRFFEMLCALTFKVSLEHGNYLSGLCQVPALSQKAWPLTRDIFLLP